MELKFKKYKFPTTVFSSIPKPVLIIFLLILGMSLYSLFRDLNTSGLRPFGVLNDVFAQFIPGSNIAAQRAAALQSNDYQIIDSWGRCLITNPNANPPVQTVAESGFKSGIEATSKAGLNQGTELRSRQWETELAFVEEKDLNMTYILTIALSPSEAGIAVDFIKAANEVGRMPVIRLCYIGGCGFDLTQNENQLVDFYTAINEGLAGTDAEFIGVVGPNEPGTGNPSEASGFFPGSSPGMDIMYLALVQRANDAARRLQDYRVENGGHMYIAPVILNTGNTQNDDVKAYLYSANPIQADLFDFMMGNTYNLPENRAAYWYDEAGRSIRQWVEQNNTYMLFSEFGYFPNSGGESALRSSYLELCNDDTVDGIMFFRPMNSELPANEPRQFPELSSETITDIISSCSKEPQKINARNSSWLNCNFDSCISLDYNYSPRSVAQPVTPVIRTDGGSSGGGGSADGGNFPGSCNADANYIYSSQEVQTIAAIGGSKDQNKVILLGDSLTAGQNYPNMVNVGFPSASTYWFLAGSVPDPGNPSGEQIAAATQAFANSLTSGAFAAVIMLGTNDCGGVNPMAFESNLEAIGNKFAVNGIIPILSTFPERDLGRFTGPSCADTSDNFNNIIRAVASRNGWPLRDGNLMVTRSDLGPDGLHISNYDCLNSGTTDMLNKLREILGGGTIADPPSSSPPPTRPAPTNPNPTAWLKINCSGGGCDAKQINTIQTWLPIKSLGSTTATNSAKYRNYTPSCVELATQVHSDQYDLLNQFAGKLSSGSNLYPMPWLGSLVNCLSEMANYTKDFAGNLEIQSAFSPHPFSIKSEAKAETLSDLNRDLAFSPRNLESSDWIYQVLQDTELYIPDERTVCIKNLTNGQENCYDNAAVDVQKLYRAYTSTSVPKSWYNLDYKSATGAVSNMLYLKNNDDLLPGPEINVGTNNTSFNSADLCRRYGIRKIDDDTKNRFRWSGADMGCVVNEEAVYDEIVISQLPLITAPRYCGAFINDGTLQTQAYLDGELALFRDEKYNNCLQYQNTGELIEYKTQNFATPPQYNIEGIQDALYKQYTRLQNQMSTRNRKIVFQKDIGWTGQVNSIIRDGNRPVDLGEYLYKGEYDEAVCAKVDFFDNKSAKARGTSTKRTNVYYSNIGAIEPMQEWIDVYTNGSSLPGEQEIANPFYDPEDPSKPNNNKANILVAGLASTMMNFPLLACDQVNICENYSNNQLREALKAQYAADGLSGEALDKKASEDANRICPFENKLPKNSTAACIANIKDNDRADTLAKFLCSEGYSVDGVCQTACPIQDPTERPPIGKYGVCPFATAHTCFQGPKGGYSHCASAGHPLDLYTNFGGGITADKRDYNVFAPENGLVSQVNDNTGVGQGMNLIIKGAKSGVSYSISHLEPSTIIPGGTQVLAGDKIGEVCTTCAYNYQNQHIHVRATYNGEDLDPYYVFGDILGCSVIAPTPGMTTGTRVTDSRMCHSATGMALNDNYCTNKGPTMDNNLVKALYEGGAPPPESGEQLPPVVQPGIPNACGIGDVVGGKTYSKIDCLLQDIANYISQNYKDGVPAAMLKATMMIETSMRNAETGNLFSGDPAETSYNNSGVALGPMQFTLGTWNGLIQRHRELMLGCTTHVGLNITDITPDHRAMVGPAVCATAIKHIDDVDYWLDTLPSAENWGEQEVTMAARRYYGACEYSVRARVSSKEQCDRLNGVFEQTTNGMFCILSGNYCSNIYAQFKTNVTHFQTLDCSDQGDDNVSLPGNPNPISSQQITACKLEPNLQRDIISVQGYNINTSGVQDSTENRKNLTCEAFGSQTIKAPKVISLHWTDTPPGGNLSEVLNAMKQEVEYDTEGNPYLHRAAQFVVSTNGEIFQIGATPNSAQVHTNGLSYTSIAIYNQGNSEASLTQSQITANIALVNALKSRYTSIDFIVSRHQIDNFVYTSNFSEIGNLIGKGTGISCRNDVGEKFLNSVGAAVGLKYYQTPNSCVSP